MAAMTSIGSARADRDILPSVGWNLAPEQAGKIRWARPANLRPNAQTAARQESRRGIVQPPTFLKVGITMRGDFLRRGLGPAVKSRRWRAIRSFGIASGNAHSTSARLDLNYWRPFIQNCVRTIDLHTPALPETQVPRHTSKKAAFNLRGGQM
jgi:hypothetical protein